MQTSRNAIPIRIPKSVFSFSLLVGDSPPANIKPRGIQTTTRTNPTKLGLHIAMFAAAGSDCRFSRHQFQKYLARRTPGNIPANILGCLKK